MNCCRACALACELRLPVKKIRDAHLAPAGPLKFVARGDRSVAPRQIFPRVQILAPIIQKPCLRKRLGRFELLLEVMLEADEHIGVGRVVTARLIVELPSDHRRVVFVMRHDVPNQSLGIKPVCRRIRIHVLAKAICAGDRLAAKHTLRNAFGEYLRMLVRHPRRNCIGRRAENHLDAGLAHRIHDPVHPRVFELAVGGFPQAPRRLAHAHHVQPRRLHQRDILLQSCRVRRIVAGHVLVVIGNAVQNGWKVQVRGCTPHLLGLRICTCENNEAEDRSR